MRLSTLIAMENLGVPYIWGGNEPMKGLDCSGLLQVILRKLGTIEDKIDRTAQGLFSFLITKLALSCNPKEGCVLFFGDDTEHITHVALAVSDEWMIEAAHGGPAMILEQRAIDKGAKVEFNKILNRKDLVACLFLNTPFI